METTLVDVPPFIAFTLTIVLLFIGKEIIARNKILQKYSIPEPVIGGFLCASIVGGLYYAFSLEVSFQLEVRDILLLYFFAGIGLKADIKTLLTGGKPLLILVVLASVFIVLQNGVGMSVASVFGLDPKAGLMSGSVALIGGVGTTMAWAPKFINDLGVTNAMELGIASNTVGLIGACLIGGPIARYLITKNHLSSTGGTDLDIGTSHQNNSKHVYVDYYGVLRAWLWLNSALMVGYGLNALLEEMGVMLPLFVSCLMAGIILGNLVRPLMFIMRPRLDKDFFADSDKGLSLIQDICLGMFLTMALMSLQIWELEGSVFYILVVMGLQVVLSVMFTLLVVFRLMGKDYEAAVICSGFGGVTLGSTATAIVNMTAVTQQYGAAHRAFIIVPLVCGFFIDIINAVCINFFYSL